MDLEFKVTSSRFGPNEGHSTAYLIDDNWDDYSFKTLFKLIVFDEDSIMHEIGYVKIGYFGQEESSRTKIPQTFLQLDKKFFSLGQGTEYYQKLTELDKNLKNAILNGLNDLVNNEQLLNRALEEEVTKVSLLRDVSVSSIQGQFKRLLEDKALLTEYHFQFKMPQERTTAGLKLEFSVDPDSNPPSNIHVLIGRNGVGKTFLLNKMILSLIENENTGEIESTSEFSSMSDYDYSNHIFAGVVSIAFSAFDGFEPYREKQDKTIGTRYSYVGLKRATNLGGKRGSPKSHDMLTNEFIKSLNSCIALGKLERWKTAIHYLDSDPLFNEFAIQEKIKSNDKENKQAKALYNKMSSGHRIVLLTITKLVEKVEEKTLVLIDEPEAHLHPPLLSAFIRSLSEILADRNGVAIIATHSPVVLQEVPRFCVWNIRRMGLQAIAERPEIETFGENVGILTREIFGLEVTASGYHQLLRNEIVQEDSYQTVVSKFGNNLGTEAKAMIRALIAEQKKKSK